MLEPGSVVGGWIGSVLRELALWAGVLLSLASGISVYVGWKQRRKGTLVSETPRSEISERRSPGVVRIRGTVVPRDESATFTSPVKGDEGCVLSAWEIEEQYDTPKTRSWESAACGVRSVPFYVADESGKLLVDIGDRTVGNETAAVFTPERLLEPDGVAVEGVRCGFDSFEVHAETGYEESPPPRLAEFVDSTDGISSDPMTTDLVADASKRKYYEQTLQQGDAVSVLGRATARGGSEASTTSANRLTVTPSADATLHLSTQPFDGVSRGRGSLLFGLLAGIVGVGLLFLSAI